MTAARTQWAARREAAPILGRVRIVITGAAGMLGSKLAARLLARGRLGEKPLSEVLLVDAVAPEHVAAGGVAVRTLAVDLAESGVAEELISGRPDAIFHLAAVVSGEAEAEVEKGYRVNVDASRRLFEAIRRSPATGPPRVVFSSSIAVFGSPFPDVIGDQEPVAPATSYGIEKAIVELLVDDYTRRGVLDGVSIRLPTLCVRPGQPNLAASGFFSSIIREPLNGAPAVLPVSDEVRHWFASPRAAVGFLIHAATLPSDALGRTRAVTMPGVSATVAMQIDALRRVAGEQAASLIIRRPDAAVARIVASWPARLDPQRALTLGFRAETNFDDLVHAFIDDELDGRLPKTQPHAGHG
jgi:D-erythronate 2-dehydrogenase